MYQNKQLLIALLKQISYEAKVLALQLEKGANWPGDLSQGLFNLAKAIQDAQQEARDDR